MSCVKEILWNYSNSIAKTFGGSNSVNWVNVEVNPKEAAESVLGTDSSEVGKTEITADVFRTHEDVTTTLVDLDDSKIKKKQSQLVSIAGAWDSNFGRMAIIQSGNNITGTYVNDKAKIEWTLNGRILIGKWSQDPSYSPPEEAGDPELIFSENFKSFTGPWSYGFDGENWDGDWHGSWLQSTLEGSLKWRYEVGYSADTHLTVEGLMGRSIPV